MILVGGEHEKCFYAFEKFDQKILNANLLARKFLAL